MVWCGVVDGRRVGSNSFDPMFATMRARKRAKSSCSIVHSIGLTRPSDMVVRPDPLSLPESLGSISILYPDLILLVCYENDCD